MWARGHETQGRVTIASREAVLLQGFFRTLTIFHESSAQAHRLRQRIAEEIDLDVHRTFPGHPRLLDWP